jgi:hypothetical protein
MEESMSGWVSESTSLMPHDYWLWKWRNHTYVVDPPHELNVKSLLHN